MMNSGLTTSSTSSLRTCGCISSGLMDLCNCKFLRWSQTWASLIVSGFSFSLSLPLLSVTWAVVAGPLAGDKWGKKVIDYLSLLHILGNQVSCFFLEKVHIFPGLPSVSDDLYKLLLSPLTSLARFNSVRALAFIIWSLATQTVFLCSFQATCPYLHPL